MAVLAATIPSTPEDECYAAPPPCGAGALPKSDASTPAPKRRRGPKGALPVPEAEGEQCQEAAPIPPDAESTAAPAEEIDGSTSTSAPESPESCVIDVVDAVSEEGGENDPLWEYVISCTARDAAKAVALRAVLEERCGKDGAKSLLAYTKATVAQDALGKQDRVLKLGGCFIKLKSEV